MTGVQTCALPILKGVKILMHARCLSVVGGESYTEYTFKRGSMDGEELSPDILAHLGDDMKASVMHILDEVMRRSRDGETFDKPVHFMNTKETS